MQYKAQAFLLIMTKVCWICVSIRFQKTFSQFRSYILIKSLQLLYTGFTLLYHLSFVSRWEFECPLATWQGERHGLCPLQWALRSFPKVCQQFSERPWCFRSFQVRSDRKCAVRQCKGLWPLARLWQCTLPRGSKAKALFVRFRLRFPEKCRCCKAVLSCQDLKVRCKPVRQRQWQPAVLHALR